MQQEKIKKLEEVGTVTIGTNNSIPCGGTMHEVRSSITMASNSRKDEFARLNQTHSEEMQAAQLRYTRDMFKKNKGSEKRFGKCKIYSSRTVGVCKYSWKHQWNRSAVAKL